MYDMLNYGRCPKAMSITVSYTVTALCKRKLSYATNMFFRRLEVFGLRVLEAFSVSFVPEALDAFGALKFLRV